jgi:hypothetical protein
VGGQDNDPFSWRALVGGRQLEWPGTPHLYQHGAGDFLPVAVPWYGHRRRPTRGCALVDPLGSQVVHHPWHMLGWCGEYVLGKFSR